MRTPLERVPSPLLVLGAIVSVQCGSAVAAKMFDRLEPTTVVFFRLLLSALVLCVAIRPKVWRWSRASLLAAVLLGLSMSAMNLVFYQALSSAPLGAAVTVEFLGPLLLALVQTRRLLDLAFALLAAAGVALLGISDAAGGAQTRGLVLAFVAGLFWAGYIVASARVGALLPGTQGLAVSLAVGAAVAGVVTAFREPQHVLPTFTSGDLLLHAVGVALLSSVVPYSLEMAALRRLSTRVFGVLMSLEPMSATLAGLVILGQSLTLRSVVALVLVSVASLGVTLTARAKGVDDRLDDDALVEAGTG
ncbi:inner membrane transporter RhtA [Motilibacter peucedani]|uniref:Inner membrane transporter RhtA n=1 Tax=Motilibacter peucedani TaxID=598650 RepID=A0A420XQ17_9ACTN|nr:EamA family transporter [Motilibacter peucedani]RKS75347.1 inner membrane transporter RhtA [Motilibacter peucedani]